MTQEQAYAPPTGYRVIRTVGGGSEAPWAGTLAADPDGEAVLLVDSSLVASGWAGWTAPLDGHVLAPRDVVRRTDGHDIVLPLCTERMADLLARRCGAADLTPGEGVTLAVSLLRGLADAETSSPGSWWLTDDGRPVLAIGSGDLSCLDETQSHLRRIAEALPAMARPLADAVDFFSAGPRRPREIARIEAALFAVAAPTSLSVATLGPRRARTLARGPADQSAASPPGLLQRLARHVDADWADLVSRTTTGAWRAWRDRPRSRRRPWAVAGGAAGVILIAGLLWPAGTTGPAGADTPSRASAVAAEPSPSPGVAPPDDAGSMPTTAEADSAGAPADAADSGSADDADDLAAITSSLLDRRTACAGDAQCLSDVQESPDATYPSGAVDVSADRRSVTLLDEFGGAAVLRVDVADGTVPSQLVVIVRLDGGWSVRDVYDIAD